MQYFKIFLIISIMHSTDNALSKDIILSKKLIAQSDKRVAFYFESNISCIKSSMQHKRPFSADEIKFIYLSSFFSGLDFEINSYSGAPSLSKGDVIKLQKWYNTHRGKIKWDNVQKAINILDKHDIDEHSIQLLKLMKVGD